MQVAIAAVVAAAAAVVAAVVAVDDVEPKQIYNVLNCIIYPK